jgi:hypothetical protein
MNLAGVAIAKAEDPVSRPNSAARIFPSVGPLLALSSEELEIIKKRQREMEAEYAARPKPPPRATGIFSVDGGDEHFKYYHIENRWHEIVRGEDIDVFAGARMVNAATEEHYDPLTVHGSVIIIRNSSPDQRWKTLYTPTAVGSLRIIAAEGNVLTLQSRQGHKFSLNVETEQLTPLDTK